MRKSTVDKDLKRIVQLEKATSSFSQRNLKIGLSVLFLVGVWIVAMFQTSGFDGNLIVIAAAIIGGYMALNIGANDVANNVGPAVGSKALTMTGALIIAATCEAAGALFAGGDVVTTISKNIIDASTITDSHVFVLAMMSALLSAALWINLATYLGAPVSTTHSVVGGVVGAGIAAVGVIAVNWPVMGAIAASWVISPVLGGIIAAFFLSLIKKLVIYKEDKITAAKHWVPVMVGILACAFSTYFVMKGLKKIWKPDVLVIITISTASFFIVYFAVRSSVVKVAHKLENRNKSVNELFTIPLICAAAMLSFAHGANDVANAVGPLAAIVSAVTEGGIASKVQLQLWVLAIGAIGIAAGLVLFGPKIIQVVGEKITKLNKVRAFCVALSAAITVIVASGLGLPVSSTHIAIGAVFGVGFLREFIQNKQRQNSGEPLPVGSAVNSDLKTSSTKKEKKSRKRMLVRRQHLFSIIAAWIITVPASAILSGILFFLLNNLIN